MHKMWPEDVEGSPAPGGGVALVRAAFRVGEGVGDGDGESSSMPSCADLGLLNEDMMGRKFRSEWRVSSSERYEDKEYWQPG